MSKSTKRRRQDSGAASRPSTAGASAPRTSGSLGCILNATNSESLKDAPAETGSITNTAKALARWENEGGRVLHAGQRPP
jgi:hypothetical protein